MYNLIKTCLDMAVRDNARSIAFPTLGCGRLNYKPKDVAECFVRAVNDAHAPIQVLGPQQILSLKTV